MFGLKIFYEGKTVLGFSSRESKGKNATVQQHVTVTKIDRAGTFESCCETIECSLLFSYLEHLLDFLSWQVDIELVQELEDLTDA